MGFARLFRLVLALLPALATGHGTAQPPPVHSVLPVDDAIVFKGRIDSRSAAEFLALLKQPDLKRVVITSGGGNVAAAIDMALAIHERQLDVEVPAACLSSCANYIFPAGRSKTLGHPTAVGWHGNMQHVLYLQQNGQADPQTQPAAGALELALREVRFYRQVGVDGFVAWFGKVAPYNVDDFYALSVADMAGFGIGDVAVRDPAPAAAGNPEVRVIAVDWQTLEANRPALRLQP